MAEPRPTMSHRIFIERLIIAILITGFALLLWQVRGIVMLVFGAVLVAVILRTVARPFGRRNVPHGLALLLAVLIVLGLLSTAFWLFGAEVAGQTSSLQKAVPAAWTTIQARLDAWGMGEAARGWSGDLSGNFLARIGGWASSLGGGIADALLVIVGGIFSPPNRSSIARAW